MLCRHLILILIFKRGIACSIENITNLLPVALFLAGVLHNEIRYMEENIRFIILWWCTTGTTIVMWQCFESVSGGSV